MRVVEERRRIQLVTIFLKNRKLVKLIKNRVYKIKNKKCKVYWIKMR